MFPASLKKTLLPALVLLTCAYTAAAAEAESSYNVGYNVRVATLYVSPDPASTKMAEIDRGRPLGIVPGGGPPGWLHVMPTLSQEREITGWILDKGVVFANTPNGDRILFGEAVESETEASRPHGRRGADKEALRLYYAVYDLFPKSPLAGEALYRSADIRWQLEHNDVFSRPSAKEMSADMRGEIDPYYMKEVMKKFPGTKWADLAAYHLIDNKLCGDWQGLPKCPEKESELYEKYAAEHPQSPTAPEALYKAAYRQAALVEIYRGDNQAGKSAAAKQHALALTSRAVSMYPQNDWASRAQTLGFLVEQGANVYSNVVE